MGKLLKLTLSPNSPAMEEAMGLLFQIHVPYGKDMVTLLINPNVTDYQENMDQPDIQVRQFTFSEHTRDTKTISLDFVKNNVQTINYNGNNIDIKLMNISQVEFEGQNFPSYEIFVSESEYLIENPIKSPGTITFKIDLIKNPFAFKNNNFVHWADFKLDNRTAKIISEGKVLKILIEEDNQQISLLEAEVPPSTKDKYFFVFTWSPKELCLYVDAQLQRKISLGES